MLASNYKGIMYVNPSWASLPMDSKPFLNRQDERKATDLFAQKLIKGAPALG